jgi:diketogulonate reductase-like aldo/keto reductase
MTAVFRKELGATGVAIPELGLGTWNYHAGSEPLRRGLEAGALFIDTAESYGTEGVVRAAVAGMRDQVFIATKVSPAHFHGRDLERSVDGSLKHLGVDRIDLLQLHEPNPAIPISETMGAVSLLVDRGKVRFVGVSNFPVAGLREAQSALGKYPIVSNQVRYNLIDRTIEHELLGYCQAHGVTVIAYCPLARGLDRIRDCDPSGVVDGLARALGKSPAQIVLNWCLSKDGVVAIPKGNSQEHVLDNCGASGWRLGADHARLLDTRIRYRRRNALDTLVRRATPRWLGKFAVRTAGYLPRGLRRRIR